MSKKDPKGSAKPAARAVKTAPQPIAVGETLAPKPVAGVVPAAAKRRPTAAKREEPATRSKPPRPSGLAAAAKVLTDAREPMRCGDLVKRILAKGLWKTTGKTPAATINAAIIREIRAKGKDARFKRAGRGLFSASGKKTVPS